MRVAAIQLRATPDRDDNLARAEALVEAAAHTGATFVVLPELFSLMGPREVMQSGAEPFDGPTLTAARRWAADAGIWLQAGSFLEEAEWGGRAHNTSCLVDPAGDVIATYRKIHLFDNDVPGAAYRESDTVAPGDEIVTHAIGTATETLTIGCTVCYDLRFPELYRILALRGAELIVVPAAFTATTGPHHWSPLLQARAIENQVFVVAADQHGASTPTLAWHGHSMVLDPWGRVLAAAGPDDGDTVVAADIDLGVLREVRDQMPSLANRRPAAYAWPAEG